MSPRKPPTPCAHPGCPRLAHGRFCPEHQRAYDIQRNAARPPAAARGYDADWRKARKAALARDGHRCRRCGLTTSLDVHHVVPISQGGARLDVGNLLTLCRSCHAVVEAERRKREKASR